MVKLSAINDEIAMNFEEQLKILENNSILYIELRKINNQYLCEFSKNELHELKKMIDQHALKVSLIDSPIGKHKVPIMTDYFEIAKIFECDYIRIFYNEDLKYLNDIAKKCDITLLIENEKNIQPENITDIKQQIKNYSNIKLLFDIENLYSSGFDVIEALVNNIDFINYIHLRNIKNEKYVKLNEGNINYLFIIKFLKECNYNVFVSAEFHFSLNNDNMNTTEIFIDEIRKLKTLIEGRTS